MLTEAEQRVALSTLAVAPRTFLSSDQGIRALRDLCSTSMPRVAAAARSLGLGLQWCDPDEMLSIVIVQLCEQKARVAKFAAQSRSEPWQYLGPCLVEWMRQHWGSRHLRFDELPHLDSGVTVPDHALTPAREVSDLCVKWLRPRTPVGLRERLRPLVQWLVENPPQRLSYEAQDVDAAFSRFTDFSRAQVAATSKVIWGRRPNRGQTSLAGALLIDAGFQPFDSMLHARELLAYKQAMRQSVHLSHDSGAQLETFG